MEGMEAPVLKWELVMANMRTAVPSPVWPAYNRGYAQNIGTTVNYPRLPHQGDSWFFFREQDYLLMPGVRLSK